MTKTIQQSVEFKGVSPKELFDTYMDSKKHSAAIGGAPVSISREIGSRFTAFGKGHLIGTILHIVSNRMIVQSWRGQEHWKDYELDSILSLTFEKISGGSKITLVHSGVPERTFDLFNEGWKEHYWKPWKKYFEKQCKTR